MVTKADIYGNTLNGATDSPSASSASGYKEAHESGDSASFSWIAFALILIAIRVLYGFLPQV
jgi:hypothetical protein